MCVKIMFVTTNPINAPTYKSSGGISTSAPNLMPEKTFGEALRPLECSRMCGATAEPLRIVGDTTRSNKGM